MSDKTSSSVLCKARHWYCAPKNAGLEWKTIHEAQSSMHSFMMTNKKHFLACAKQVISQYIFNNLKCQSHR